MEDGLSEVKITITKEKSAQTLDRKTLAILNDKRRQNLVVVLVVEDSQDSQEQIDNVQVELEGKISKCAFTIKNSYKTYRDSSSNLFLHIELSHNELSIDHCYDHQYLCYLYTNGREHDDLQMYPEKIRQAPPAYANSMAEL